MSGQWNKNGKKSRILNLQTIKSRPYELFKLEKKETTRSIRNLFLHYKKD